MRFEVRPRSSPTTTRGCPALLVRNPYSAATRTPAMRPVTRTLVVAIALVVVALLALGALPSYLGAGDPYHLTVEPADADGAAVDVSEVSERRYPYLTSALASDDGRSHGYQLGPYGLKEHFTHTPFDERDAIVQRGPDSVDDDGRVLIEHEGERYYLDVVQAET